MQRRTFSAALGTMLAAASMPALGFKVRKAPNLRARYGHLAGTDRQRAEDVNAMFADPGVQGLLATLKHAGAFGRLAGVAISAFVNCTPGKGYAALTLDELFDDYFKALNIPAFRGAQFGQVARKFTLPIGLPAEMDAGAGTLRFLGPAVA